MGIKDLKGRNETVLLYTPDDFLYRKPKEFTTYVLSDYAGSARLLDRSSIF